ncbi:MAG: hypothetical protein JW939_02635 [Candidatus Thermoplasmatota archaeon]|nr:hypothetical protein [Candidatus Thermoplasmatota archaeon]
MDVLALVATAKIVIVMSILAGSSVMDIRYRRIPDRFWSLMLAGAGPLTIWEMYLRGGAESPASFLALLLPLAGILFVLFGYPELGEIRKGSVQDISFFLFYIGAAVGGMLAFLFGDRSLFSEVGVSFIFMLIYFVLYSVPIGGTRIIHGGADAKCLISLAALFPWYTTGLPFQTGPFYEIIGDLPAIAKIFPVSLSVLFNAAVITALVMFVVIPLKNLLKGEFTHRSFTSYRMDVEELSGSHVWVLVEKDGRREKNDPTVKLIKKLRRQGMKRVSVTPKIPFILSLTAGFLIHTTLGNLVAILFLIFQ